MTKNAPEHLLKRANAKVAAQEAELIQLRIKLKELTHIIASKDEEIEELRDQLNRNRW